MRYRLTQAAERQFEAIPHRSVEQHGTEAAHRYAEPLLSVMRALAEEPRLIGAVEVPRLPGVLASLAPGRPAAASRCLSAGAGRRRRDPRTGP